MIDKLAEKFLAVEKKYNLFENYNNDEVPLWSLLRMQIWWTRIVVKQLGLNPPQKEFNKLNNKTKLLNSMQLLKGSMLYNPFIGLDKYDFLFLGAARRKKVSAYFLDIYTDYLIQALKNYNCLTITRSFNGYHYHPVITKNLKYLDYVNILTFVKSKTRRKNTRILTQIENMLKIFSAEFKIKWDTSEAERLYYEKVFNFLEYQRIFEKILPKIRPKIIFEIVHYNSLCMALNIVADKMNIPTIEIQHGTINQYHIGYNYSNLESGKSYSYLPKYIFLFGEFWKSQNFLPIPNKKQIVTGFPYLEIEKEKLKYISKIDGQILFLSQKLIGERLAKIAYQLSQNLASNYKIIYKLHPAEYFDWKEKYHFLHDCKNLEVADGNYDKSLYKLFAESDFQVGVFSTALFEGIAFNLITFILNLPGSEYMDDLIKSNCVFLVNNSKELLEKIKNCQDIIDISRISKSIWQNNAINNMKSAIESIIGK